MADGVVGGGSVNIDLSGVEKQLEHLVSTLSGDEKKFIKEVAAQIYANTSFDTGTSPYQIASNSISRAMILVDALKSKNLL